MSLALGMSVTLDRTKRAVVITQDKFIKSLLEQYDIASCNLAYTPGMRSKLSLNQPD